MVGVCGRGDGSQELRLTHPKAKVTGVIYLPDDPAIALCTTSAPMISRIVKMPVGSLHWARSPAAELATDILCNQDRGAEYAEQVEQAEFYTNERL